MLRLLEAEALLLETLRARHGNAAIAIVPDRTVERAFGWLFFLTLSNKAGAAKSSPGQFPRQVIVNRYSGQIVASSIEHTAAEFVKIYEELLAQHEAHESALRLTNSSAQDWQQWWQRRVARQAAQLGLYQLGDPEQR